MSPRHTSGSESQLMMSTGDASKPAACGTQLVSLVVPCCNEEDAIGPLYEGVAELADILMNLYGMRTELVLVDDGSVDETWNRICQLAAVDDRIRGFRLSRNFGHQAAIACGYQQSRGNATISLDADLQDPLEVVIEMVEAWRQGADIVFGVRLSRVGESVFKRVTAWLFYWVVKCLGATNVRRNVGDFRLLSRRAIDALMKTYSSRPFFRDTVGWIGFRTTEIKYVRPPRLKGATKFTPLRMIKLAFDALVSSSMCPLQYSYCAAAFVGIVGLICSSAVFWNSAFPTGKTELVNVIVMLGCTGLILFGQGIHGSYLARTFEETRCRPIYVVADLTTGTTEGKAPLESGIGDGFRTS
jgi:dolichol-phosphate mannosyltransferase